MEKLNVNQYAKLKGVSHTAVQKAIKNKRLVNSVSKNKKTGKDEIDPVMANLEWDLNTDKTRQFTGGHLDNQDAPLEPFLRNPPPGPDGEMVSRQGSTLNQSRAVKEIYNAKLAKLQYEEKIGKLVDSEKVKNEIFRMARATRDSMLNIPDRVAAEFAGATDAHFIHSRLTEEIKLAIEGLQNA